MAMICEKCRKEIAADAGAFIYYQGKMLFACKACENKINDEIRCGNKVSAAVDGKKVQAVYITENKDAFDDFLKNIEKTLKKVPAIGNLLADIPLLVSLVKSYITGEYKEIPYNSIVAIIATLLYVISPVDIIPDVIPGVGFTDDAMAVAFCVKMLHDDLRNFKAWRDGQASSI